jgi:TorA maturation chaperone TorD
MTAVVDGAGQQWLNKAALYEIEALAFLYTKRELAEALASGEYAEALAEIVEACGLEVAATEISGLAEYQGRDTDELFHELRREHTRLFVGSPKPAVSPFAGVWFAEEQGVQPLLFVNKESMAVERFYRSCGVGQPEGTNEPLDHIGSELEFLQYLSLLRAGVTVPPEGVEIPVDAYEQFYREHFIGFAHKLAAAVIEQSRLPLYQAAAAVLAVVPDEPL